MLVVAGEESLEPCTSAYDRRVAGVVSGAGAYRPGILLDRRERESGRLPVALVGKVYCRVEADFGAVAVGDLLTTSSTPGHAMKATDPARTPGAVLGTGAVLGKALRAVPEGRQLIPILVSLQ
ncbi:MAG: hypothetical protein HY657_13560 [Acidobacteria bacterium]|nr:hypothetical protein [Acidobacteriota bacterium]